MTTKNVLACVAVAAALGLAGCCFGTELERAESLHGAYMKDFDELAKRAEGDTVKEIEDARAKLLADYEALPTGDDAQRAEALQKLNTESYGVYDALEEKVDAAVEKKKAEAQKLADEKKWENINKVKGVWQGNGMDLSIDNHGQVSYKRTTGGSSKSVDAPITSFKGDKFEVGAFGITTTFKIDEWPHEVDGETRMKVDGVELTLKEEI